jgi:hypothetical protein
MPDETACMGSTHDEPLDVERGGAVVWAIIDMVMD